ncbi:MAG: hypothetical protein L3J52_09175, partial [Proteobacteria bacterium]|nr:hypothetical protein [Pseudomonadota bacterium]
LLQNILQTYPNNPRSVYLLTQASQQTQDWKQLRNILPKAKKLAIINTEQNKLLSHKSLIEEMNLVNNAEQLMTLWYSIDKKIQPNYINAFCENGLRIAAFQQVTDVIEKQQKTSFSDSLIQHWSRLPHNLNHRIKLAEKWLSGHPDSSKLLSCLGQLHIEKKQWLDAENYLLKAHDKEPDNQINQLLGRVYQELNQPEKALMHYQQSNSNTSIIKPHTLKNSIL